MKEMFDNLRKTKPLIHSITNYVTANDVANVLLACGASPIMADEELEVKDITSICTGLNINMGTLNKNKIISMKKAGIKANAINHPVVLDPVGAGASKLRIETAYDLISHINFQVIKGNMSEIKMLAMHKGKSRGVDVHKDDIVGDDNLDFNVKIIKQYASIMNCVIVVTGAIDLVSDGKQCYVIKNGTAMMSSITGTGCQLSALICAFISANPENILKATAAAVCTMGYAGEVAKNNLLENEGNATYRNRIIDAIYQMDGDMLEKGAKYEIR